MAEHDLIPTPAIRNDSETTSNQFTIRVDNTTYLLNLHFSESSRLTLEDKIKRLIRKDIERLNQ